MKDQSKEFKKKIIIEFLQQCNSYSKEKIKLYQESTVIDLAVQDKIKAWNSYKEFNEYAIKELKKETLDDWF